MPFVPTSTIPTGSVEPSILIMVLNDTGRGVELMGTICEAYETHRDELMYRPGDVVVKVKVTIIRVRIIFQLKYNKKTIVISRIVNNLV